MMLLDLNLELELESDKTARGDGPGVREGVEGAVIHNSV